MIKTIAAELKNRNRILYFVTVFNLWGALLCLLLMATTSIQVLGVNAFLKPFKFFASITVTSFTLGWMMFYLQRQTAVRKYSWMLVITMLIEVVIITMQAALGKKSHFSMGPWRDIILYQVMGIAISTFTIWTAIICYRFFRQELWPSNLSDTYVWGMRLGLLFFVLFAFEGFYMVLINRHTIGAADGQAGLPLTNWSRHHGDLRIAHFFGLHALQLMPLLGYYVFKTRAFLFGFASCWFLFIVWLLWRALEGLSLFT
jgi:hypothetical protein